MTYAELLQANEWQAFRQYILERDKKTCKICKNANLLKDCNRGSLIFSHAKDGFQAYRLGEGADKKHIYIKDSETKYNRKKIPVKYKLPSEFLENCHAFCQSIDNKSFLVASKTQNKYEEFYLLTDKFGLNLLEPINAAVKFYLESVLKCTYEEVLEYFKTESFENIEWKIIKGLHVHHKYYQNGKKPWEYRFDALITVCWKCHEEIHKGEPVPHYDESFKRIGNLTPCSRCHGAGYFPEYLHIEEGICFRCRGAMYDEFFITHDMV